MDPLEHFDEPQRSEQLLEQHREALVGQAVQALKERPGRDLVGVAIEPGTPEEAWVRRQLGDVGAPPGTDFVGIMAREIAIALLRANHTALLDWLVDSGAPGAPRVLPLVAFTRNGARTGAVELDLAP